MVAGVAFPVAIPGVYDYAVPLELRNQVFAGTPVLVEVRKRQVWGVVVVVKNHSEHPVLKPLLEAKTGQWADNGMLLMKLYRWIADYYQCDLGRVFRPLVSKGIISASAKKVVLYSLSGSGTAPLRPVQAAALDRIRESAMTELTITDLQDNLGISKSTVQTLCKHGYLEKKNDTVVRQIDELSCDVARSSVSLTSEQVHAVESMAAAMDSPEKPFLLHGITGSGKTHVYTELTAIAMSKGRGVIILVPEISLTPQTIHRFRSALGDCLTVIHSHMSDGERRDSVQELATGKKRVVIGVRSAVLAPVENLGLIIVDEEHDGSYKQSDMEPRYNARDVAVMRGSFQNALVVLGSGTPSLESQYNALCGKYHLIKLLSRFGPARLPRVEIVDMAAEHEANNWTIISRYLNDRIVQCLQNDRQIILLLNRRGFSTVLICKDCGHTYMCARCSVTLRYHRSDSTLKCHQCGHDEKAPERCVSCGGAQIKYKGTGIQKAEEMIRERFPGARILRMDQDTTRRKGAHASILGAFADGDADILLGTQMVSKGLNFPRVALVGVLQADTGLHFPDFRSAERTFQLLTQVAGRAGRSDSDGEVVIQTYFPGDSSIKSASIHDYEGFYKAEIESRRELHYPPFGKLARIVVEGSDENEVIAAMGTLSRSIDTVGAGGIIRLGPAPAVLARIEDKFRYSVLLKSQSYQKLGAALSRVRADFARMPHKMKLIIDVDPLNML